MELPASQRTAFVVYTRPQAEGYTAQFLKQFGFEFYFPKVRATISHARKRVEVIRPFFPRYVFVYDRGDGVHFLREVPGISTFLRRGMDVVRVRQDLISKIQEREDEFGLIRLEVPPPPPPVIYDENERIRFVNHALGTTFDAIFCCEAGEGRASILVSWFGKTTKVEVGIEDIRKLTPYEQQIAFPQWLNSRTTRNRRGHRGPAEETGGGAGGEVISTGADSERVKAFA